MGEINRNNYRELNNILWDTKIKFIKAKDALELYERRWAYVDVNNLEKDEEELIRLLTINVGNGFFMPVMS